MTNDGVLDQRLALLLPVVAEEEVGVQAKLLLNVAPHFVHRGDIWSGEENSVSSVNQGLLKLLGRRC